MAILFEHFIFWLVSYLLVFVSLTDAHTMKIPPLCPAFIAAAGLVRFCIVSDSWREGLPGCMMAAVLLLTFHLLSRGKGLGGGDVKLMAAAGLFLGPEGILTALLLGSSAALVWEGVHALRFGKSRAFAFGPYLAAGIWLTYAVRI